MDVKKYAFLAKNILQANLGRPDRPYKLTFSLTSKCNYRCQTCNIWKKPPQDELSVSEIERFFRKTPGFSWIDLTGGEIFLRKDFLDIVRVILDSSPNLLLLHFPTNGYLTDTIVPAVREIASWRPEKLILTVSMDGNEKVNDRIRGIPGGWKRQMATFKGLRAIPRVQTVLGMTISSLNVDQFETTFQAAKAEYPSLSHDDFHVNIVHTSGHYFGNSENDLVAGKENAMADAIDAYRRSRTFPLNPVSFLEKQYLKRVRRFLQTNETPIHCQALRSSCFIDPSGNVYPCTVYDRRLGGLREADYDLLSVWNSENARRLQKEIWDFKCPQCWTPCEAYQSILGSLVRFDHGRNR